MHDSRVVKSDRIKQSSNNNLRDGKQGVRPLYQVAIIAAFSVSSFFGGAVMTRNGRVREMFKDKWFVEYDMKIETSLLNQFIYGYIDISETVKEFDYADTLMEMGISS